MNDLKVKMSLNDFKCSKWLLNINSTIFTVVKILVVAAFNYDHLVAVLLQPYRFTKKNLNLPKNKKKGEEKKREDDCKKRKRLKEKRRKEDKRTRSIIFFFFFLLV